MLTVRGGAAAPVQPQREDYGRGSLAELKLGIPLTKPLDRAPAQPQREQNGGGSRSEGERPLIEDDFPIVSGHDFGGVGGVSRSGGGGGLWELIPSSGWAHGKCRMLL